MHSKTIKAYNREFNQAKKDFYKAYNFCRLYDKVRHARKYTPTVSACVKIFPLCFETFDTDFENDIVMMARMLLTIVTGELYFCNRDLRRFHTYPDMVEFMSSFDINYRNFFRASNHNRSIYTRLVIGKI